MICHGCLILIKIIFFLYLQKKSATTGISRNCRCDTGYQEIVGVMMGYQEIVGVMTGYQEIVGVI